MWRYTSLFDLINIVKASTLGTMGSITGFVLIYGFSSFPKSVLLIDYVLCTILLAVSRASIRIYFSNYKQSRNSSSKNSDGGSIIGFPSERSETLSAPYFCFKDIPSSNIFLIQDPCSMN